MYLLLIQATQNWLYRAWAYMRIRLIAHFANLTKSTKHMKQEKPNNGIITKNTSFNPTLRGVSLVCAQFVACPFVMKSCFGWCKDTLNCTNAFTMQLVFEAQMINSMILCVSEKISDRKWCWFQTYCFCFEIWITTNMCVCVETVCVCWAMATKIFLFTDMMSHNWNVFDYIHMDTHVLLFWHITTKMLFVFRHIGLQQLILLSWDAFEHFSERVLWSAQTLDNPRCCWFQTYWFCFELWVTTNMCCCFETSET